MYLWNKKKKKSYIKQNYERVIEKNQKTKTKKGIDIFIPITHQNKNNRFVSDDECLL